MTTEIVFPIIGVVATFLIGLYGHIITRQLNKNSKNHFEYTERLANDRMLKELFTEFNMRYDRFNDSLNEAKELLFNWLNNIQEKDQEKMRLYSAIIDFFNLCAEEYYWHKKGRLEDLIWKSWSNGMNDIFDGSQLIQSIWKKECEKDGYKSYYIDKPNEFFLSFEFKN